MKTLIRIDEVVYDIMVWNKTGDKRTRSQKAGSWTVNILGIIFGIIGVLFIAIIIATLVF